MEGKKRSGLVKVCGMREQANIEQVLSLKPDYIGFIFYEKSKRFASDLNIDQIDFGFTKKIGVFVNADHDFIIQRVECYQLDGIQLHGDETVQEIKRLKKVLTKVQFWKAFRISDQLSLEEINNYEEVCDLYILDSAGPSYGGNGVSWNYELLKTKTMSVPFLLSGGIDASFDLNQIKNIHTQCIGIDLNSKFESIPGVKNFELLKTFFDAN